MCALLSRRICSSSHSENTFLIFRNLRARWEARAIPTRIRENFSARCSLTLRMIHAINVKAIEMGARRIRGKILIGMVDVLFGRLLLKDERDPAIGRWDGIKGRFIEALCVPPSASK